MLTVTRSRLMSLRVAIFTYFTVKFPYIFINKYLHVFWTKQDKLFYSSKFSISQLPSPCNTQRREHHSMKCFSCFFTKSDKNRKNVLIARTSYNNEQKFLFYWKKKLISHLMDFTSLNKLSHFKFSKPDSEQQQEKWLHVGKYSNDIYLT